MASVLRAASPFCRPRKCPHPHPIVPLSGLTSSVPSLATGRPLTSSKPRWAQTPLLRLPWPLACLSNEAQPCPVLPLPRAPGAGDLSYSAPHFRRSRTNPGPGHSRRMTRGSLLVMKPRDPQAPANEGTGPAVQSNAPRSFHACGSADESGCFSRPTAAVLLSLNGMLVQQVWLYMHQ